MKNSKPEDNVFVMCAGVTVLATASALAALVYQLIIAAVPLVESVMSQFQRVLVTTGY
jgi:biotin transporter BioY